MRLLGSRWSAAVLALLWLPLGSCATTDMARQAHTFRGPAAALHVPALPALHDQKTELLDSVRSGLAHGRSLRDGEIETYSDRIAHYMAFLGLEPGSKIQRDILSRLLNSSTQFILCDDLSDWACLEKTPAIVPTSAWRRDSSPDLGSPVRINERLELESYFTEHWDRPYEPDARTLAHVLGEKIERDGARSVLLAIYGIDDIHRSMKPVHDAIVARVRSGADVRAVFDTNGVHAHAVGLPLIFSYLPPEEPLRWIFSPSLRPPATNLRFQYNGTPALIHEINRGITSETEARARVEWPDTGIMHNKFVVLENEKSLAVWTGTTNVSETCMGTERNTNMAVYLRNAAIARVFHQEFEEMHGIRSPGHTDSGGKLVTPSGSNVIPVGRFHTQKSPNTRRYFVLADHDEVRVHFSPTDDAEHRVLIPMLLSAREGDVFRIAMFGGSGHELVRAFQYAAAQGAEIRLVFDRLTGAGRYSWINDPAGTILDPNPYASEPKGRITVRMSTWRGLNHHKTATLSRRDPETGREHAQMLVVGSQNWSKQGNDLSDENLLSVRNLRRDVEAAVAFNRHFDARLWPAAESGELKSKESAPLNPDSGDPETTSDPEAEAVVEAEAGTPVASPVRRRAR